MGGGWECHLQRAQNKVQALKRNMLREGSSGRGRKERRMTRREGINEGGRA